MKDELTIEHLASDIRDLAREMNSVAISLSALIRVLKVDKDVLKKEATKVLEEALEKSERPPESNDDNELPTKGVLKKTHPKGAFIFGGDA
jgi:hypothetical protein